MANLSIPEGIGPWLNPATIAQAGAEAKKNADKVSGKKTQSISFKKVLEERELSSSELSESSLRAETKEEALQLFLDEVHESGEELKNKTSPTNILRYKNAVRQFLHYVVENGYTVSEKTSGTNILKRKKFTILQVVDRKLEQLAAGVLSGQATQLQILSRIDEIRGLLIDLTR